MPTKAELESQIIDLKAHNKDLEDKLKGTQSDVNTIEKSSASNPNKVRAEQQTDRELELEKLRLDAQLRVEGMKADVRKVVFGTMIVGLAVAFFPFAQELSNSWFARSVEEIRKEAEFAILQEKNRLAKELETQKFELEQSQQLASDISARREYLERLADEARSERIERQIIIAEFFSFLGEKEMRTQWEGFRDYLITKQANLNSERSQLLAKVNEAETSTSERESAEERLRQIERLQNPEQISQTGYNLSMPADSPSQSRIGRRMLQLAINEANTGVHEVAQSDRVADYWSSLGLPYTGLDRTFPWSAAFVSWVIKQSGNPHGLQLSPTHISNWRYASEKGLTIGPDGASPVPGDIAVRTRRESDVDAWNSQDALAPGFSGFVYEVNADEIVVIGGNASHSVRPTIWHRDDPRILGFIRLPDLTTVEAGGVNFDIDETDVNDSAE